MSEDRVDAAIRAVDAAVRQFEQEFLEAKFHDTLTKEEAVNLLFRIREVTGRMKYADDMVVEICEALGLRDPHAVEGQGVAEGKWGKDRKTWDHAGLTSVAAEKILGLAVNKETGTVDMPYHVLITKILEFAHVDYWRKAKCAELGIDIDEYCAQSPGRYSVQLTRNQRAGTSSVADD